MQTSRRRESTSAVMSSVESGSWPEGVGQNEKKKWLAPFTSIHAPKITRAARASCFRVGACTVLATLARTANIDRKLAM